MTDNSASREPAPTTLGVRWHTTQQVGLEQAIDEFKKALPGWWYSVCECQVSCDASCAPTLESPDVDLIDLDAGFDSGFHADLLQPSSLAEALLDVMAQALAARRRLAAADTTEPAATPGRNP